MRPLLLAAEWPFLLALVLWFVGVALVIGVRRNVPVIDDWTYAWSVEHLLAAKRLKVLDWSAVYPVGQALWGAAWSLLFGFSFTTLRLSTLSLALTASMTLYLILRELEAPRRIALLGALSVAANPVVLLLSFSFMTDVPFICFTLMALLCYVRAVRRDDPRLVWWGGLWACAAFLVRQVGIVTPFAALPLLLRSTQTKSMRRSTAAALAATWAAMFACSLAIVMLVGPTGETTKLVRQTSYLLQIPVATYVKYNLYVLSTIAFYAFPALLAMATAGRMWRTRVLLVALLCVGAIMLAFTREIPIPLRPGSTWTVDEVGGTRSLINGRLAQTDDPALEIALRGAGLLAAALALMALRGRTRRSLHAVPAATGQSRLRRVVDAVKAIPITARSPLVVYLAAYLMLANMLWMYSDRYLLILVPVIVALALGWRQTRARVPHVAWVATAVFAVVAVVGTRDTLRFNEGVRDSWQSLVDRGVRPSDIDAGYAWTGWILYAHPTNLANGLTVQDVPWITSTRNLPYVLSETPIEGYEVDRTVSWSGDAPWPGPDRLLILKRRFTN